jgi:hypothetical protein
MEDAEAVVEALQVVARGSERICYSFVADYNGATVGEHGPARPQHVDGIRRVVKRLENEDQVVGLRLAELSGVQQLERDAILGTAAVEMLPRGLDRGCVGVNAVDPNSGIGAGDRDARLALAACDVRARAGGSARRRASTDGIAGSHSLPSRWLNIGRVKHVWPACRSLP